jgi:hypothetical protein
MICMELFIAGYLPPAIKMPERSVMVAKNGDFRFFSLIACAALLAVCFIAHGESLARVNNCSSRQSLSSRKKLTPYEILRRSKSQPAAEQMPENFSVGPVIAEARLNTVPISRDNPTIFFCIQHNNTTTVRPPELREQPADAPKEPVYFVVHVGDRNIHGITYRSISNGQVKLYLDTDGDGLFSDEMEYVGTWLSIFSLTRTYLFGPVSARHRDTVTKAGQFYAECSDGKNITFRPAFYRRGQVIIEGKSYQVALIDTNFDGNYNKYFAPPIANSRDPRCDVLAIDFNNDSRFRYGEPGISEIMPLCRLININGQYYSIDAAEDGGTIEFRQAKPQFGTLSLNGKQAKLALWSDAGHQRVSGSNGKWLLPAGKYSVVELELTEPDSQGNRWTFDTIKARAWEGQLGDFEIRPGQTTSFQIGPPFQIKTFMKDAGRNALVGFHLEGQAGELYVPGAKKNSVEVPKPQFKIISVAGQTVHTGQFEFR